MSYKNNDNVPAFKLKVVDVFVQDSNNLEAFLQALGFEQESNPSASDYGPAFLQDSSTKCYKQQATLPLKEDENLPLTRIKIVTVGSSYEKKNLVLNDANFTIEDGCFGCKDGPGSCGCGFKVGSHFAISFVSPYNSGLYVADNYENLLSIVQAAIDNNMLIVNFPKEGTTALSYEILYYKLRADKVFQIYLGVADAVIDTVIEINFKYDPDSFDRDIFEKQLIALTPSTTTASKPLIAYSFFQHFGNGSTSFVDVELPNIWSFNKYIDTKSIKPDHLCFNLIQDPDERIGVFYDNPQWFLQNVCDSSNPSSLCKLSTNLNDNFLSTGWHELNLDRTLGTMTDEPTRNENCYCGSDLSPYKKTFQCTSSTHSSCIMLPSIGDDPFPPIKGKHYSNKCIPPNDSGQNDAACYNAISFDCCPPANTYQLQLWQSFCIGQRTLKEFEQVIDKIVNVVGQDDVKRLNTVFTLYYPEQLPNLPTMKFQTSSLHIQTTNIIDDVNNISYSAFLYPQSAEFGVGDKVVRAGKGSWFIILYPSGGGKSNIKRKAVITIIAITIGLVVAGILAYKFLR